MEERLVVTVKTFGGMWNGSAVHPPAEPPRAFFENLGGEAYTRSWKGSFDARLPMK